MSVREAALRLKNDIDEMFENGKNARDLEWWENYVDLSYYNDYARYMFAGDGWNVKTFTLPLTVIKANCVGMLAYHNNKGEPYDLVEQLKKYGGSLDFSKTFAMQNCFQYAKVSRLGIINISAVSSATNCGATFASSHIITIDEIVFAEKSFDWNNSMFNGATSLMHLTASGVLANTINFQWCPLTPASMKSLISILKNFAGTSSANTKKITFNEDCWSALEADSTAPDGGTWRNYVTALGWLN